MSELKEELREHFIKPLKFKFLVQNLEKDKEKDGGHTATLKENHFICANISSGKQSQHNTAGNCRTKHACQIRPHSVHEKKYIPAFLLPYKVRNAGSNWYGRNTC